MKKWILVFALLSRTIGAGEEGEDETVTLMRCIGLYREKQDKQEQAAEAIKRAEISSQRYKLLAAYLEYETASKDLESFMKRYPRIAAYRYGQACSTIVERPWTAEEITSSFLCYRANSPDVPT